MKRFLLGEFKLTAMEYKTRFDKASKRFDERHVLFASRLHNELRYYLSSRGVGNFEKLYNLLVLLRLFGGLGLTAGTVRRSVGCVCHERLRIKVRAEFLP